MYKQIQIKITISQEMHNLIKSKADNLGITMSQLIFKILLNELNPPRNSDKAILSQSVEDIKANTIEQLSEMNNEELISLSRKADKIRLRRWAVNYGKELRRKWRHR